MPRYNGGFIGHDGLDAPDAPTIGTPSAGSTQADIAFTAGAAGTTATTEFVATTNDGIGATGTSSPITITGLTNGTSYTARVYAKNSHGTSAASEASASFTPLAEVIDGLFSTFLYTGNSSTRTITNDINLSGKGGLVWIKDRDSSSNSHILYDTERGAYKALISNLTNAESTRSTGLTGFTSSGFTLGSLGAENGSSNDKVSWTFRKTPKFFDIVQYSGNGSAQTLSHNLGSTPGMIIVKRTDSAGNWRVFHRSLGATKALTLSSTGAEATSSSYWNDTAPTSTQFTIGTDLSDSGTNNFIAYLFAHNNSDGDFGPDSEDIIKCDTYTGNGSSTGPVVTLGFEPQFIMLKRTDDSQNASWFVFDNMRGIVTGGDDPYLYWNNTNAEVAGNAIEVTPTGFQLKSTSTAFNGSSATYIYMAIRRGGMSTPTAASDVFKVVQGHSSNIPNFESGFPVDFGLLRQTSADGFKASTRLIDGKYLETSSTAAESSNSNYSFDYQDGWVGSAFGTSYYSWMWKRARGYFDVVAFTKTTSGAQNVSHNLGAVPEMMWIKVRNDTDNWTVYHKDLGNDKRLLLNGADVVTGSNNIFFNNTTPTASQFTIGSIAANSYNFVAYLFATVAGVSKVGSYTGNGSSSGPTVDCGFSGSPSFVLIKKATGGTGSWYVFDSARGISAGTESQLYLNNTSAEQTATDQIDPTSSGFQVVINSGGLNTNGETYIFYAIAATS